MLQRHLKRESVLIKFESIVLLIRLMLKTSSLVTTASFYHWFFTIVVHKFTWCN